MTAIWKAQDVAMIDLSGAGDLVAAAWRADRAYLIDLAYRMLGDIGLKTWSRRRSYASTWLNPARCGILAAG
jgi:hypothetical protein